MASATTERPNKVTVEDAGPSRKKLTIEIPADTVSEQLGTSLDTLMNEAALPGFRKGRAPKRLVEKKFGSALRDEAKNQLVATAYQQAIEEHKLSVIGEPVPDDLPNIELTEGKPFAFSFEVEVQPDFDLPSLENIEVLKPTFEVTDEMVQKELDRLAQSEGELESRDKAEPGVYLTGHAEMTDAAGDESFYDLQDAVVQIPAKDSDGSGMILGILVDDLAKQLGNPKTDDTITITTKGPENHETEALRGKDLKITFTVGRIDAIIPANLADVATKYGLESEDQLKDAIKARLQQRIQVDQNSAMRQQVAKYLVDNTSFDLPERITAQQAARNLSRRRMELLHRGIPEEEIERHIAELRAASDSVATRELQLFFILNKAAEQLDVQLNEGEVNAWITQLAHNRGQRPDKLRQELIKSRRIGEVVTQVREYKTMDAILAKAKVEELTAEEFNKRMGSDDSDKPAAKKKTTTKKTTKKKTSKKTTTKKSDS